MENKSETFAKFAATLEKYRKNKTMVPPDQLAGKYKAPFEKLKAQLKAELEAYLKEHSLEGLQVKADDKERFEPFAEAVNQIFSDAGMTRQIGKAAYEEYDLDKVQELADQLKRRVYDEAWLPYFQSYTCLYATEACLNQGNPQSPRIYNSLVDKFWDDNADKWIEDKTAERPTVLIYFQKGEKTA